MPKVRFAILIVYLLAAAVADAADGSVSLYLQPLAPEAGPLRFTVASVSAIAAGGTEHPLTLNLKTVSRTDVARQRLLASGRLPAGSYTGFALTVKAASLKNQQGESPLNVPDAAVRLDAPFSVGGQQAALFWLTLRYQESVPDPSSFSPAFSVATPPVPLASRAGFVSNSGSNTVTVFDKKLAQAVALVTTCGGPSGMALDQYRRRLYVACAKDGEIQSIDVATGQLLERARVSPGDRPRELALTPDGSTLVSVNTGSNSVSFFDAASLDRGDRVAVGSGPGAAVVDPAGRRVFVFNTFSSSISVIDVRTRGLVGTISTDPSPVRGQFNARGDRLFVIHERSPYMTVVDPAQLGVLSRARLRVAADAIRVDTVRNLLCIGSLNDPAIEFYEPNALLPLYSMRIRAGASYLDIDVEENVLYVVSPETHSLVVGRLADRKVASEIDVGDAPYWVAVMGEK